MKIAVLGASGMLGSDLVRFLSSASNKVTSITRDNYEKQKGKEFDLFINANGNSKRFWALQNVLQDFEASTVSVYKTLLDFKYKKYIYISSVDVYSNPSSPKTTPEDQVINTTQENAYGFHKYLSEEIVKKHTKDWVILRSSTILGTNMKKGPVYDILNENSIFITLNSRLQLITTDAISKIIETLANKKVVCEIINIGGSGVCEFTKIGEYFESTVHVSPEAKKQVYEMNVKNLKRLYPNLKTSEDYLEEYLNGYKKN